MRTFKSPEGIVLTLHEGTPLRVYIISERLEQFNSEWEKIVVDRFIIAEAIVNGYQFADENCGLAQYYARRDGKTLTERFELFQLLLDIDESRVLYDARMETRFTDMPLEIPADVDESEKKDTSSNGSAKGKQENALPASPQKVEA